MPEKRKCLALTSAGTPCKSPATKNGYCPRHQPKQEEPLPPLDPVVIEEKISTAPAEVVGRKTEHQILMFLYKNSCELEKLFPDQRDTLLSLGSKGFIRINSIGVNCLSEKGSQYVLGQMGRHEYKDASGNPLWEGIVER